jgi:hypothetical protein
MVWFVAFLLGLASLVQAQEGFPPAQEASPSPPEQINPPFGLFWAERQSEINLVLERARAKVVSKEVQQGREAWTVTGLVQPALKRTILYFGVDKTLVEVELQYEHPEWDLLAYEEFFNSARKRLESKYGIPTVLARDKQPQGDVMQTVVGYRWQQAGSSIELFFYSAERNTDVYRTVSLHYRAG